MEGVSSHRKNIKWGGEGGRELRRRVRRGPADRDQGGDEGGRSQGRDSKDAEQEAHIWTQATAITTPGGPDGGRSHGGGMATTPGGQAMAAEQVMEEPEAESQ